MEFSERDIKQIKSLGISSKVVENQLERFKNGFPELKLSGNIFAGNGLRILTTQEVQKYTAKYDEDSAQLELVKFVPASGAASRMFKLLYNYLEDAVGLEDNEIQAFFKGIGKFAFSDELAGLIKDNLEERIKSGDKKIVELLLAEQGLNYGNLPKALLTFHKYIDGTTTKAIDEHLIEGANYCSDMNGRVCLHFTVSEEHMEPIKTHLSKTVPIYEARFGKHFDISFSVQDTATNTLAVDMDNEPFRIDGELLFRPGGHGALLTNLNAIDADVIFIKNIDNVAANWLLNDTVEYKKALGAVLLETQNTIFNFCKILDESSGLSLETENSIISFLQSKLGFKISASYLKLPEIERKKYLAGKLNRPTRICGVVESKNTGGGPFWVKHPDGSESFQLVETDQINKTDNAQLTFLNASNYANITDLFCGVKNYKGEKFDLTQFSNPETGFISHKSLSGKPLKAMELPGLWNGAMSDWNTAFVEVPMSTFNPVKTVLDLLKKEHQGII